MTLTLAKILDPAQVNDIDTDANIIELSASMCSGFGKETLREMIRSNVNRSFEILRQKEFVVDHNLQIRFE